MKSGLRASFQMSLAEASDLPAILKLQQENLVKSADGFVTVVHPLEILQRMQQEMPHIVARGAGGKLAGYALSMAPSCRTLLPILAPMFGRLDECKAPLGRYYAMGQICVAEEFRGSGVFDALYAEHRARFSSAYDCVVTEISTRNPRSLRAHARVGFTEVDRYRDATDDWIVVALYYS